MGAKQLMEWGEKKINGGIALMERGFGGRACGRSVYVCGLPCSWLPGQRSELDFT
mgnify:CR=1 FL=1